MAKLWCWRQKLFQTCYETHRTDLRHLWDRGNIFLGRRWQLGMEKLYRNQNKIWNSTNKKYIYIIIKSLNCYFYLVIGSIIPDDVVSALCLGFFQNCVEKSPNNDARFIASEFMAKNIFDLAADAENPTLDFRSKFNLIF